MKKSKKRSANRNLDPLLTVSKIRMLAIRIWNRINWKKLFRRSSRQKFRSTKIYVGGKPVKSSIFIAKQARLLSVGFPLKNEGYQVSLNYHKKQLTEAFKKDHVKGLTKYKNDLLKQYKKAIK